MPPGSPSKARATTCRSPGTSTLGPATRACTLSSRPASQLAQNTSLPEILATRLVVDPANQLGRVAALKQAAEHFQMQHFMPDVERQMSAQIRIGAHPLPKGLDLDACGHLRSASPADTALHRERHFDITPRPSGHRPRDESVRPGLPRCRRDANSTAGPPRSGGWPEPAAFRHAGSRDSSL